MDIVCRDISGKEITVQRENLKFRPTVYGVTRKGDEVLLVNIRTTGKRYLPGGGIELGESTSDALIREFKEETGIDVEVMKLLGAEETYFYDQNSKEAWQVICLFFDCKPISFDVFDNNQEFDESENPEWVKINSLKSEDFQCFGDKIMKILNN